MCFGYMSAHHVNLSDHTLTSHCIHQRFVVDVRQWRGWHGTSFGSSCTRRPLWIHVCTRNKKSRISQCNVNTTSDVLPEKVGHTQTHRYVSRRWLIDDVIDDDVPLHDRLTSWSPSIKRSKSELDVWILEGHESWTGRSSALLIVKWKSLPLCYRLCRLAFTNALLGFPSYAQWQDVTRKCSSECPYSYNVTDLISSSITRMSIILRLMRWSFS